MLTTKKLTCSKCEKVSLIPQLLVIVKSVMVSANLFNNSFSDKYSHLAIQQYLQNKFTS